MAADVITNLELDKDFTVSRVIVAKEINGCDSSFITSCILGHCIKNNKSVLIINTHNSLTHYYNVGLKMNYNIQKHISSGLINFYNIGGEDLNLTSSNKDTSLKEMYAQVEQKLRIMKDQNGTVNVIIDGVSHLFDLKYKLSGINWFCRKIINIVRSFSNSFVIFHCNVASDDDVTCILSNLLAHQAHTVVEVENLSSGWSTDVTGHLNIKHVGQKFDQEHMCTLDVKSSKYLFKLFDRGVKLFAPGTV